MVYDFKEFACNVTFTTTNIGQLFESSLCCVQEQSRLVVSRAKKKSVLFYQQVIRTVDCQQDM